MLITFGLIYPYKLGFFWAPYTLVNLYYFAKRIHAFERTEQWLIHVSCYFLWVTNIACIIQYGILPDAIMNVMTFDTDIYRGTYEGFFLFLAAFVIQLTQLAFVYQTIITKKVFVPTTTTKLKVPLMKIN